MSRKNPPIAPPAGEPAREARPARPQRPRGDALDPVVGRPVPVLAADLIGWLVTSLSVRLSRSASSYYQQHWNIGTTEYRLVLALEPGHATHAARYEAAMRARNKLLAEPEGADPSWLAALESGMAEHGEALAAARQRTVAALGERLGVADTADFPAATLSLEGWSGEELSGMLRRNRGRDASAGRTTEGPHRQDLGVIHEALFSTKH